MQHIERQEQSCRFNLEKAFLKDSKDAMDTVKDVIEQKVAEVIGDKVTEEKVVEAADKVVDWAEVKVEQKAEEVAAKVDEALKPVTDIIAKLEENPEVKKAIDAVVAQVDGRLVTCWCCCGWDLSLRISRRSAKTSLGKPAASLTVELPPVPSVQSTEVLPPKVESLPSEVPVVESKTAVV